MPTFADAFGPFDAFAGEKRPGRSHPLKSPAGEPTGAMNGSKLIVLALVGLLVVAGAVTAAATGMPGSASDVEEAQEAQGPRDVDAAATYDNGTVTVTVTANGSGVENVTVLADDERVGTTDANGTVTFETNASEELELELHKGGFEGELKYAIQDGSLVVLEEEYEYPEVETDDEDDENEAEDEDDENEADEDDETEDGDEESEDEEADENEDDEDEDDEQQESDDG